MNSRIKQIREYFGLSQIQFAQKINKSAGLISNVEIGKSGISLDTISRIHTVFGVDEDWLKTGQGTMFPKGAEKDEVHKECVGNRIRQTRKELGLSQEQFAKALGCHKMHIYYVETGKYVASNDFLMKISSVFNVNYNWLMTGQGEMSEAKKKEVLDERLIEWLRAHPDVVSELKLRSGLY